MTFVAFHKIHLKQTAITMLKLQNLLETLHGDLTTHFRGTVINDCTMLDRWVKGQIYIHAHTCIHVRMCVSTHTGLHTTIHLMKTE
jgi:hypothetical protein